MRSLQYQLAQAYHTFLKRTGQKNKLGLLDLLPRPKGKGMAAQYPPRTYTSKTIKSLIQAGTNIRRPVELFLCLSS